MATTRNFTVGPAAWTRIASGRPDGQIVKVDGAGPFVLVVTVGTPPEAPTLPVLIGHRYSITADIPLVNKQFLWACATTSTLLTVT